MVCFVHEARTRPPAAYRHFFDNDDELPDIRSTSLKFRWLAF